LILLKNIQMKKYDGKYINKVNPVLSVLLLIRKEITRLSVHLYRLKSLNQLSVLGFLQLLIVLSEVCQRDPCDDYPDRSPYRYAPSEWVKKGSYFYAVNL